MQTVQVSRWGNSLGVRIPKDVAAAVGVAEGSRLSVVVHDGQIVLALPKPRYRLEDLIAGVTPEDMCGAYDWGPDVGREDVSE
ncbi:AbrB/MazE/SpoVT family DNA-binding domain-containing protein [Caenispirillum bisanense]|uniref:Antitoxin MazE n=1 Tax=Caenispirillum bisanense TaxID=414052 RepID=A0A286GSY0_9PROT|nr:AbrB/MazE/SpoVT family DNA-binding domain-containing protein [Caenispirillum bisanense]SOD98661.1 antitoxin MazE [Caenispirillum bisanense]